MARAAFVRLQRSGDTGSAALEAFANRDNVCLTVLFPADRVSATQAAQMTRVGAPNCAVFRLANATSDSIDEKLLNPLLAERMGRRKIEVLESDVTKSRRWMS